MTAERDRWEKQYKDSEQFWRDEGVEYRRLELKVAEMTTAIQAEPHSFGCLFWLSDKKCNCWKAKAVPSEQ